MRRTPTCAGDGAGPRRHARPTNARSLSLDRSRSAGSSSDVWPRCLTDLDPAPHQIRRPSVSNSISAIRLGSEGPMRFGSSEPGAANANSVELLGDIAAEGGPLSDA